LQVLNYLEIPEDDRPPEEIWLDEEALAEHFDMVKSRHRERARGRDAVEIVPLEQNELTKHLKEG
jgi:hypothetical protein